MKDFRESGIIDTTASDKSKFQNDNSGLVHCYIYFIDSRTSTGQLLRVEFRDEHDQGHS